MKIYKLCGHQLYCILKGITCKEKYKIPYKLDVEIVGLEVTPGGEKSNTFYFLKTKKLFKHITSKINKETENI